MSGLHRHRWLVSPFPRTLELGANKNELEQLEEHIDTLTLERTIRIVRELVTMHKDDPNFSDQILSSLNAFLAPSVLENPEKHPQLVREAKLEALLATENSPYAEVRANVDPTDDPTMPVSTVRAWVIGISFSCVGTFIDNLFAFRYPSISLGVNVAQLVACGWLYPPLHSPNLLSILERTPTGHESFMLTDLLDPLGKFFARVLPDRRIHFFGNEIKLNPGPFNRKEHMLISIMANVSFGAPYTFYIIPCQALPQ